MGGRPHVLVVRDGETGALADALEAALDAAVSVEDSAAAGVDRAADEDPDCVVTGHRLPDGDGPAVAAGLDDPGDPPVVLYTDADPADLGERAVTAPFAGYVRTSAGPSALVDRVRALLGEDSGAGGDPDADPGDGGDPGPDPDAGAGNGPGREGADLERYETILESVADPVYTLDPDGYITYANRAAVETFGYPREEFVGAHVTIGMEPEDVQRGEAAIRELLADEDREQATIEYEILARDGTRIPVENKIALLPSGDGFRGSAGVLRDVSDRRRRERRLQVLTRFLRYNVRNEVALIETHAAQLEAQVRDDESRELARELRDRARSITKTSHDARRLERAIDRDFDDVTPTDAAAVVERVVRRYRGRFPVAEFHVDCPETAVVAADSPLRPALANVVENAVVHNDRDRPTVRVSIEPDDRRPAERLAIRVADDGPGIPDDVREAVLGDVADEGLRAGGGLGLFVATWIVQSFGGEVTIEDRDPRGTAVTFHLRRADG